MRWPARQVRERSFSSRVSRRIATGSMGLVWLF
jgi:hypothetical protein